jgi:hypothetical protein
MKSKRAHILLPDDLVKEIDAIVGPRGRSAFLVETAREAVRRKKLLRFLEGDTPAWKIRITPIWSAVRGRGCVNFDRRARKSARGSGAQKNEVAAGHVDFD